MQFKVNIEIIGADAAMLLNLLAQMSGGKVSPMIDVTASPGKAAKQLEEPKEKKKRGPKPKAEKVEEASEPEEEETDESEEDDELDESEEEADDADESDDEEEELDEEEEDEGRAKKSKKKKTAEKVAPAKSGKKKITLEGDLLPALSAYTIKHNRDKATTLLKKFGIKGSIRKAPEEIWPELLKALEAK